MTRSFIRFTIPWRLAEESGGAGNHGPKLKSIKTPEIDVLMLTDQISVIRTTLTLDDDVAMLLKKKMDKSGETFRDVVNRGLRVGLTGDALGSEALQIPQPRSMGGARVDLNQALSSIVATINAPGNGVLCLETGASTSGSVGRS